ncbi:flagellar hook-length control protein FliK [Neobacillus novalis]|uniref:Flagellar hook-length control protein FliK n=1 Tax=Neobacillus novalis TaxID=220687 RepID=A0AA95MR07_9BACI|nr:flagellar hook-length control protein FliK [Neobacillus novalis]WHY88396.1 flagellar hook-length control protein FliK [Neobacillus novalis]
MIQPPIVGNKYIINGTNRTENKEKNTLFDELLQSTAGNEQENDEGNVDLLLGLVNILQAPSAQPAPQLVQPQVINQPISDLSPNIVIQQEDAPLLAENQQRVVPNLLKKDDYHQLPIKAANHQPAAQPVELKENEIPIFQQQLSKKLVMETAVTQLTTNAPEDLLKETFMVTTSEEPVIGQKKEDSNPFNITGFIPPENRQTNESSASRINPGEKPVFPVPVRATNFQQDVGQVFQAAIKVQEAKKGMEATFTLQPEHLGKVDVKVLIKDGNVTAEFLASTPLGKDLLQTNVQALHMALEQQGFRVDKIDISQQFSHLANSFSQKGDSNSRQGQPDSRKRNERYIQTKEEAYLDFPSEIGWSSQINTTA